MVRKYSLVIVLILLLAVSDTIRAAVPDYIFLYDDIIHIISEFLEAAVERTRIKLVILGNGQIGKSTLLNFFKHFNLPQLTVYSSIMIPN